MSKGRPTTLSCPWWVLRAAFMLICEFVGEDEDVMIASEHIYFANGWRGGAGIPDGPGGEYMSTITLTGDKNMTTIVIEDPEHRLDRFWDEIGDELRYFVHAMHEGQRHVYTSNAERAIERYYRSRARGRKMTLRELAEETGYSMKYLSNVKARYDREGRWGSQVHKKNVEKADKKDL